MLPAPAVAVPALPGGTDLGKSARARVVTPNGDFYRIDTALTVPQIDPDRWQLRIHGMVDTPITLTYADLLARPLIERWITLACVSNEVGGDLIGNARCPRRAAGRPPARGRACTPGADQLVMHARRTA